MKEQDGDDNAQLIIMGCAEEHASERCSPNRFLPSELLAREEGDSTPHANVMIVQLQPNLVKVKMNAATTRAVSTSHAKRMWFMC